jgi:hypothetical protein
VQDNTQEGIVDLQSALIVLNEAEFPKFIHEEIDSRSRCANYFRQRLLRYFGNRRLGMVLQAIASKQQKSASKPFLARVKKLIDQILFDSDVP